MFIYLWYPPVDPGCASVSCVLSSVLNVDTSYTTHWLTGRLRGSLKKY